MGGLLTIQELSKFMKDRMLEIEPNQCHVGLWETHIQGSDQFPLSGI